MHTIPDWMTGADEGRAVRLMEPKTYCESCKGECDENPERGLYGGLVCSDACLQAQKDELDDSWRGTLDRDEG